MRTPGASVCPSPSRVLVGVYHPDRLRVIDPCRHVTGIVISTRGEADGDFHFDVRLDPAYRSMLTAGNYSEQDAALVVELMPRDHGHLPTVAVGERVSIMGAYVDDSEHGWSEIHPVWALSINGGGVLPVRSGRWRKPSMGDVVRRGRGLPNQRRRLVRLLFRSQLELECSRLRDQRTKQLGQPQ